MSGIFRGAARSPATMELTGIWTALPTPFKSSGAIDVAAIRHNVRHCHRRLGLAGIFCNGFMGEVWSLTTTERRLILETIVGHADARLEVGVVTSHYSLAETIALSKHARDTGAHHIVLMCPVGPFDDGGLCRYILGIADAVDIPIVLFDAPSSRRAFTPRMVASLLERAPIIGVKCTRSNAELQRLRKRLGRRICISDPLEEHWLANALGHGQKALYADPEPYLYQTQECRLIGDYTDCLASDRRREDRARQGSGIDSSAQRLQPLDHATSAPRSRVQCGTEALGRIDGFEMRRGAPPATTVDGGGDEWVAAGLERGHQTAELGRPPSGRIARALEAVSKRVVRHAARRAAPWPP